LVEIMDTAGEGQSVVTFIRTLQAQLACH
jgi:hypothetical protein